MSTVALTIDYSNGAQKHFSNIQWNEGLTILEAIEASQRIPPGAVVKFGSDRSGHALGLVIDEMPQGSTAKSDWLVWVNDKPFRGRLGTETSFGFHPAEREANLLKPGDQVLVKLSLEMEKPS
jgi:hypothetical protein